MPPSAVTQDRPPRRKKLNRLVETDLWEKVSYPEYREHVKHRTAGVEDSRLLCLFPTEPGEGFGE